MNGQKIDRRERKSSFLEDERRSVAVHFYAYVIELFSLSFLGLNTVTHTRVT